jgi:hypothetical protein
MVFINQNILQMCLRYFTKDTEGIGGASDTSRAEGNHIT